MGQIGDIGDINRATGGVLSLNVKAVAASGLTADGVLEVHCDLPGSRPRHRRHTLSVLTFNFVQDSTQHGSTLSFMSSSTSVSS
jgi:hypothetical protein